MPNELLVIDDSELHQSIICKIAIQVGLTSTGATSVAEASTLLRKRIFDCITLDLSLGEQSGLDVLRLLAEMESKTPIIIISGSGDAACEEIIEVGTYLDLDLRPPIPKPIHLAILRDALTQIVQKSALDREAFLELTREVGEQAASEIHVVFTSETEARLKRLQEYPIELERIRIGREAHSLKSSAGTFGYRELASLASSLEQQAVRLTEVEYRHLLDRMETAYSQAAAEHRRDWATVRP